MASAEEEATRVFHAFYDALSDLVLSKGTEKMADIWHHVDHATTVHPFGGWARGWDEVWATWLEGAAVFKCYTGHTTRDEPVGGPHGMKVSVCGDIAIATCVFQSRLYMSDGVLDLKVNCTNIAERLNGVWKIIHHHPDQGPPDWQAAIGRMVQTGKS